MSHFPGTLAQLADGAPALVLDITTTGDAVVFTRLDGVRTVSPGTLHPVADEAAALKHFSPECPREQRSYPDGSVALFRQPGYPLWLRRTDGTFERAPAGWAGVEWSVSLPVDYTLELVIEPEGRDGPARQLAALVAFFTPSRRLN